MQLSLLDLWGQMQGFARGIVFVLAIMSIWSLSISIKKWWDLRAAQAETRKFAPEFSQFLEEDNLGEAVTLAEKYKNSLYPATSQGRGRMLQWTFFVANDVEPALLTLFRNRIFFPPEQRSETLANQAEETLRAKLSILEQQLVKTPYFGGDRWDLADFMVAGVLYLLTRLKLDLAAYPKLDTWLTASINRPAAQVARKLRET